VIAPFSEEVELLDTIPGVDRKTAEVLIAEIGADMSQFPTHRHLASWAGMCPGNDQSAGKRHSGKTRKGSKWLRSALTEAAYAAARSKGTYLAAQYARLKGRRGTKKAAMAVGHSILVIRRAGDGDGQAGHVRTGDVRRRVGSFASGRGLEQPRPSLSLPYLPECLEEVFYKVLAS
jgi:hypothetical protein